MFLNVFHTITIYNSFPMSCKRILWKQNSRILNLKSQCLNAFVYTGLMVQIITFLSFRTQKIRQLKGFCEQCLKGGEGCHHCHGYFTAFGGVVSPLSSCILPSTQSWPHVWHDVWHIGTVLQWHIGTLEQWHIGTLAPGTMAQWHSGTHPHLRQFSKPTTLAE